MFIILIYVILNFSIQDGRVLMEMGRTAEVRTPGLSEQVRVVALRNYLRPAMQEGRVQISLSVRSLMDDLRPTGFPSNHWNQICSAIQERGFLRENRLEIERVDGPPSKRSSTVVVHYRLPADAKTDVGNAHGEGEAQVEETPEERAFRLVEKLRGLFKVEIAAMGGAEAYMRWVRSDDGDEQ
jgi:hypothetical protein